MVATEKPALTIGNQIVRATHPTRRQHGNRPRRARGRRHRPFLLGTSRYSQRRGAALELWHSVLVAEAAALGLAATSCVRLQAERVARARAALADARRVRKRPGKAPGIARDGVDGPGRQAGRGPGRGCARAPADVQFLDIFQAGRSPVEGYHQGS